jgi:hypothetical protein
MTCVRPAHHAALGRSSVTCLQDFAAGWILASDMCPHCTSRLMTALDREAGERLAWHSNYLNRASAVQPDPAPATPATTNGG